MPSLDWFFRPSALSIFTFLVAVLTSFLNPSVYFAINPLEGVVAMDHQPQSHRPFSTFGPGIGIGSNTFSAHHYPSRVRPQSNFEEVNIHNFADQIPIENTRSIQVATRRLYHEIDTGNTDHSNVHRRSRAKSLVLPTLILITPITLLAVALLALVFAYEVQRESDLFQPTGYASQGSPSSILVNFSATRLVFVASFLSSIAPVLTSFVMTLWTMPVVESLRLASIDQDYAQVPTPYQLSLVIGLTLASYERLWRYLAYLLSPSRSQIPTVVHRAAAMLMLTTFLALAVFGSDAALHFTTTTVAFDQVSPVPTPSLQYGRGLSEYCLKFDRLANNGFPCSYNTNNADPNAIAEQDEAFRLQHNTSSTSEILILEEPSLEHGDMAVLAQLGTTVETGVNYKASTIGVSTQCHPITSRCNMRIDPDNLHFTFFNCTDEFWGVMGAAPNTTQSYVKAIDSNVPGLAYKPASTLQYAFFNDSDLTLPYNPIGYNSAGINEAYPPLTDSQLINPIYFALAGRVAFSSESAGSQINNDSQVFTTGLVGSYFDFALNCSITSYDVDITSINGSVLATGFSPTNNGSLLEIFQGYQFYVSLSNSADDLQDYLAQAALQNTTDALARQWGNLYSEKVLSMIGGFTTPRTNFAEEQRRSILVASVSKGALVALITCSLTYTLLGLALCAAAYRASTADVRDLAAQLSLAGLVNSAFGDKTFLPSSAGTGMVSRVFDSKSTRQETRQFGVDGANQNFDFRNWSQ